MRYALKVAYDGTHFVGWQVQPNGVSVQQTLADAAAAAFGEEASFTASGRTDSGVHAAGQVCHADISARIPAERLADALNAHLPPSVSVLASAAAPSGFDANRSAKKKTYVYSMYLSPRRNPLKDRYSAHITGAIDISALKSAAAAFIGEHDFKAYNMVRTMAGTMLGCAQGRIALGDIERSLAERDRTLVGKTMPARGLTLLAVDYGFALFKE